MTPGSISKRIVLDRLAWVDRMVAEIRSLPLESKEAFFADSRNLWTAESCLRRALEALFDLGRHILAKGFGLGSSEYKEIVRNLVEQDVLSRQDGAILSLMAGYRNRLVHFYHEVTPDELYEICTSRIGDIVRLSETHRSWMKQHQDLLDEAL